MFTWNFQYISKARLSSTLKQLNLSAEQGDILIRIHTAIHMADEAVDLARFVKELVPQAQIFGTSCIAVINKGNYALNRCVISVSTFAEATVKSSMIPIMDEYTGTPLPIDMLCGQIKKEVIEDNTKLLLTFVSGQFKDAGQFIERCNDFFPSIPMTGGVASFAQKDQDDFSDDGFVFNENGWSDRAILIASLSGDKLESLISDSKNVQGSDTNQYKADTMFEFADEKLKCLISKPKIAGFGMNWQNCHNMIFTGLSDSYEAYYQAVRRCWRFGQEHPVDVYIIISAREGCVRDNIERKQKDFLRMQSEMTELTKEITKKELRSTCRISTPYEPTVKMILPDWEEFKS